MTKRIEIKLAKIGNSHGIRLPVDWIRRHSLESGVVLEERGEELVLRPKASRGKLSWVETAREIAAAGEEWSEWEEALADGLESIPWEPAPAKNKRSAAVKSASKPSRKS